MTRFTQPLLMIALAIFTLFGMRLPAAQAAELPYLMIMGEDGDMDAVPRDSRVFRRVLNELSETMNMDGFDVYDETAVTLDDFAQGRSRRSDAELIDIARAVKRPPIDIIILFEIYASAERLDYTTKVRTRLSGRLLDVHSGRRLGNFEIASPVISAHPSTATANVSWKPLAITPACWPAMSPMFWFKNSEMKLITVMMIKTMIFPQKTQQQQMAAQRLPAVQAMMAVVGAHKMFS